MLIGSDARTDGACQNLPAAFAQFPGGEAGQKGCQRSGQHAPFVVGCGVLLSELNEPMLAVLEHEMLR
jgi:hypothetical protein